MPNRKVKISGLIVFLLLLISGISCNYPTRNENNTGSSPVMVFAAASLSDVLSEIKDSFEMKYAAEVRLNLASSGSLARQTEHFERPDIFISASTMWMNYIDSLNLFQEGSVTDIAGNRLVLIAPKSGFKVSADHPAEIISGLSNGRLSMGDPSHVPVGRYGRQSLRFLDVYDKVNPLFAGDARAALMYVELAEAPLGIVYRTDALKSDKVFIVAPLPENSHNPVRYYGGMCVNRKEAREFLAFLQSDEIQPVWEKYGFIK